MRPSGRAADEMRPVSLETGFSKYAEGSCLARFGDTHVLCTASVEERVPPFLRNTGSGWVTAEYGMLPRATSTRTDREAARGKQSGRTQEIQRLIGRSLRAVTDLKALGERQIRIDCDVLQADGGTRTASITGSYVALHLAFQKLVAAKAIAAVPLSDAVAAISCGIHQDAAVARPRLRRGFGRRDRRQLRADRRAAASSRSRRRRSGARSRRRSSPGCWRSPARVSASWSRRSAGPSA